MTIFTPLSRRSRPSSERRRTGRRLPLLTLVLLLAAGAASAQSLPSISVLGDSYSTYEGYMQPAGNRLWYITNNPRNDVTRVEQTWWHLLCTQHGYRLCQNNSYSGATICNTGYHGDDYSDRSFITRMSNLGNPDILLILGATNDDWAGVPLGDYVYSGWTKEQLYQFRPAMAHMLSYCTKRYVNVPIYFILNSELSDSISDACREICEHYHVPLIALHDIDKQQSHPSVAGMQAIADQVYQAIANPQPQQPRSQPGPAAGEQPRPQPQAENRPKSYFRAR